MAHLSADTVLPEGVTLDKITRFSASAVILNNRGRILMLLRDDYPLWVNIGGDVDEGESFEQALRRETKEEAQIDIALSGRYVDFFCWCPDLDIGGTFRHERVYVCTPAPEDGQPRLGDDGIKLEWLPVHSLPANVPERCRLRILKTFKAIEPFAMRLDGKNRLETIQALKPEDIYGLDYWLSHPKVLAKKAAGKVRYWPNADT